MKQERLNLYRIDMKYIRNLHNIDDRVSSVSPQIGKQHRIYVGTVVGCNNRKYLILLSHPVEKHKRMSPRADFDKIIDKKGKLLGELNYNLMIPVDDKQLTSFLKISNAWRPLEASEISNSPSSLESRNLIPSLSIFSSSTTNTRYIASNLLPPYIYK